MSELYIGLMSGTSMDAIDAVLVELSNTKQIPIVHTHYSEPIPLAIKSKLMSLTQPGFNEIESMGELDVMLGQLFAKACLQLLDQVDISADQIRAIGSHGQTIRHRPNRPNPFSIQIGDPNIIAQTTGITTLCDFRRRDIASGGQGAPLAPGFHDAMFRSNEIDRIVLNIGGIANITILPKDMTQDPRGFDTGPGNTLLDAWIRKHTNEEFDDVGRFGAAGKPIPNLVSTLLDDPYFHLPAPKSTGLEYFNMNWLEHYLERAHVTNSRAEDVQATLQLLTAITIRQSIETTCPTPGEIIVCGGGVHNTRLMELLYQQLPQFKIYSSEDYGINPNLVEAIAFAWLAKQTLDHKPGNLTGVTGAKTRTILGGIYASSQWLTTESESYVNAAEKIIQK